MYEGIVRTVNLYVNFYQMKPKVIVILGPTASGKSALAVRLAKKINGEIISADSRQVYRGLNIGSGKITRKEMLGVPHYLLDVASPRRQFSVAEYKKLADKAIRDILNNGRTPIICGGTGLYIDTLLGSISIPDVPPNKKLRARLEVKSKKELYTILEKLDPKKAQIIDKDNPVRLVRAIEIATALGNVPETMKASHYDVIKVGLLVPQETLAKKIHQRLLARLKQGMIAEVKNLHKNGVSWKRLEALGLEYRYIAFYLQGKMTRVVAITKLETEIRRYAKRQMKWFKRDKEIWWIDPKDTKQIYKTIKRFLK